MESIDPQLLEWPMEDNDSRVSIILELASALYTAKTNDERDDILASAFSVLDLGAKLSPITQVWIKIVLQMLDSGDAERVSSAILSLYRIVYACENGCWCSNEGALCEAIIREIGGHYERFLALYDELPGERILLLSLLMTNPRWLKRDAYRIYESIQLEPNASKRRSFLIHSLGRLGITEVWWLGFLADELEQAIEPIRAVTAAVELARAKAPAFDSGVYEVVEKLAFKSCVLKIWQWAEAVFGKVSKVESTGVLVKMLHSAADTDEAMDIASLMMCNSVNRFGFIGRGSRGESLNSGDGIWFYPLRGCRPIPLALDRSDDEWLTEISQNPFLRIDSSTGVTCNTDLLHWFGIECSWGEWLDVVQLHLNDTN